MTDGRTDRQTDGIAVASTTLAMRALRRAVKTETTNSRILEHCVKVVEDILKLSATEM